MSSERKFDAVLLIIEEMRKKNVEMLFYNICMFSNSKDGNYYVRIFFKKGNKIKLQLNTDTDNIQFLKGSVIIRIIPCAVFNLKIVFSQEIFGSFSF